MAAPKNTLDIELELRWSDVDQMGHVNNARIMTLIEEARIRAMEQLKAQVGDTAPLEDVLRTARNDFRLPVMYPGLVLVRLWVSHIGRTSFVMNHEVIQNEEVCVTGDATVVLYSTEQQKAVPISYTFCNALATVLA